ncbi:MAG TPA: DNA-binding response regulator [Bacteroidales bacterium]|nr:DNA-binding response regulator [Bacteroidales bacterium]
MSKMRKLTILLAEGDLNLGPIVKTFLEKNEFNVRLVTDGQAAIKAYSSEEIDFVILETSLELTDGFDVADKIRDLDPSIPIMFISDNHKETEDIIRGFEIGADDYVCKPFSMEEVLCRINAIARRSIGSRPEDNIFEIGNFYTFDFNRHLLSFNGDDKNQPEDIRLTGKESELLNIFCLSMNQTVDRTVILQKVWKNNSYFNARSMDVYITKIRKYLVHDPEVKLANQHGVGFKLTVHKSK